VFVFIFAGVLSRISADTDDLTLNSFVKQCFSCSQQFFAFYKDFCLIRN